MLLHGNPLALCGFNLARAHCRQSGASLISELDDQIEEMYPDVFNSIRGITTDLKKDKMMIFGADESFTSGVKSKPVSNNNVAIDTVTNVEVNGGIARGVRPDDAANGDTAEVVTPTVDADKVTAEVVKTPASSERMHRERLPRQEGGDILTYRHIVGKAAAHGLFGSTRKNNQAVLAAKRFANGETKCPGAAQLYFAISTPMESEVNRRTAQVFERRR